MGVCRGKIAGSGQMLLLLTEQNPRAGPSLGQGTSRLRPPPAIVRCWVLGLCGISPRSAGWELPCLASLGSRLLKILL